MLSSEITSTYQYYKRDTNVVASWLATTATSFGYTKTLNQPIAITSSKPASQRLKGKARKEAKKQQVFKEAAPLPDSKPSHIIAIKDSVSLAQFISGQLSDSADVPEYFVSALNRVIETRKRFSALLGEVRGFQEFHSDKKHAFFVTVLERVREAFKPHIDSFDISTLKKATRNINEHNTADCNDGDWPKNMFAVLNLYEPSESFLSAPDINRSTQSLTEYVAEDEDSDTEALFICTTFLKDLHRLQDEVLTLWSKYKTDSVDLAAVSVATNTALQLARNMEQDISHSLEKLGGPLGAISMFFEAACGARGLNPLKKERFDDDFNYSCYQEGSELYFNAFTFLNSFNGTDTNLPTYNGKFGWYDDTTQAKNNRERWQEDKAALLEVFADQALLFQLLKAVPVHDEFTKGLRTMLETHKIPVWLCFAAQVYLDVLKFLGPSVRNGEKDFQRGTKSIADSLNNALHHLGNREATVKQGMQNCYKLATMWGPGKDPFNAIRIASGLRERPSNFLEHHPQYCGLYLHYVRALFHRVGIEYVAKPGNTMHGIQLYQAVQQEGLLPSDQQWNILEAMIESQGNSTFFVGEPPKSQTAYFKNFCLSKGVSAAQWVQKRNNSKRVTTSNAGIRYMKFKGICSMSFAPRFEVDSDPRGLNAEVIDQILEKSGWLEKMELSSSSDLLSVTETNLGGQNGKVKNHRRLSPPELVHQVCLVIDNEVSEFTLDYFVVDLVCWRILRRVRESVDASMGGGSVDSRLLRTITDNNLGDVVGVVFAAVVGQIPVVPTKNPLAPLDEAAEAFKVSPAEYSY